MLEIMQFIGQDIRHLTGAILFILASCLGLSWVVGAFRGERPE